MIKFLELENIGSEIPAGIKKKGTSKMGRREFLRWTDLAKINWGLEANHDPNPIHQNVEWALRCMELTYPQAIGCFNLDKHEIVILQGSSQLTQVEQIGLEEYRLLPLSFKVKFSVPLIVFKDEPQLLKIIFIPLRENQFSVEVRYGFRSFDDFFGKPTMESLPTSPFQFCTPSHRESGITPGVQRKFKEILSGGVETEFAQTEREKEAYYKSVACREKSFEKLGNKIYGKINGFPTLAAARIPADIPKMIDENVYKDKNKVVLIGQQELHFNQTNRYELGENIKKRILVKHQREKVTLMDMALITKNGPIVVGRSSIIVEEK